MNKLWKDKKLAVDFRRPRKGGEVKNKEMPELARPIAEYIKAKVKRPSTLPVPICRDLGGRFCLHWEDDICLMGLLPEATNKMQNGMSDFLFGGFSVPFGEENAEAIAKEYQEVK